VFAACLCGCELDLGACVRMREEGVFDLDVLGGEECGARRWLPRLTQTVCRPASSGQHAAPIGEGQGVGVFAGMLGVYLCGV
jgi:hypothetical protein